jgi:hypothetical protein
MKVPAEEAVYSEHGKVIKCEFKPGLVERSIDPDKEGIPQQQVIYADTSTNESRENPLRYTFVSFVDGIKDILESWFIIQRSSTLSKYKLTVFLKNYLFIKGNSMNERKYTIIFKPFDAQFNYS